MSGRQCEAKLASGITGENWIIAVARRDRHPVRDIRLAAFHEEGPITEMPGASMKE
jgi:hypothetical protein